MSRILALLIAVAATSVTMSGPTARVAPAQEPERPNVLIIVTDDQRTDAMETMPETQRIFGDGGIEYRNAFITTPVCCPSRASIMTGKYAHNHGVKNFTPYKLVQLQTLQASLYYSGYRNAIFGKYFNGWKIEDNPFYFHDWAVFPQSTQKTYSGGNWNVDGTVTTISKYSTDYITEKAVSFLRDAESEDDRPWFLYLSTPAPHTPYVPEPEYAQAPVTPWKGNPAVFEQDLEDKPPFVRESGRGICSYFCGDDTRTRQLRTLMSVDGMVDAVFDEMLALGEDPNTLAFYLSDNGAMWGEHGLSAKRVPYMPSVRVPMFARWPARLTPAIDRDLVGNIDITPTVIDAVGSNTYLTYDGRPLFTGEARQRLLLEAWPGNGSPMWASTVTKRFQYTEYYSRRTGAPTFREYYPLRSDPHQLTNLMHDGDHDTGPGPRRAERLARRLARDRACRGAQCP